MLVFGVLIVPDAGYAVIAATGSIVQAAKDIVTPVPVAIKWFNRLLSRPAKLQRQETLADRLAQVARIQLTPLKLVGYQGQAINFTALPLNFNGETIQGVRFDWESSNNEKVQIDDSGTKIDINVVNNRLLPSRITDSNGNYITIAYKSFTCDQNCDYCACPIYFPALMLDYVTDTMGRIIQCNYDANNNLISITAPGFGGTAQNPVTRTVAQFDYESRTITSNLFNGLTVENCPTQTMNYIKHIYMPTTQTGYLFTYSAFGMAYSVSMRRQMSINGSGLISDGVESSNLTFNYQTSSTPTLTDAPAFTQRTESATNAPSAIYSYANSTNSLLQTKTYTITRPDNSTMNLTRSTNTSLVANGLVVQSEVKTSGGASMAKSVMAYVNDPGGQPQVQSVISYDDATPTANQMKVDFDYDVYGNVTNTREYGFPVSGQWRVRRRTRNVYKTDTSYVNTYLRNLLIESNVYDAQLDTNDANDVLVQKATATYDDYAAMSGMEEHRDAQGQLPPNPPGHLASYDATVTVRGNVTGTSQWYDLANNLSYTHLRKIDVFGNMVREQLSCCNEQSQTLTQSCYWAIAEEVTKGAAGGVQLTTTINPDFNTGVTNYTIDPNNLQTTVTTRDAALRPTLVTLPTTATGSASYNDASLSVSSSVSYDDNGATKNVTTTTDYDGWGRVIHQKNIHGGQVNTTYDAMGRVASVSNPFAVGGSPSYSTGYSYDALGRTTTMTLQDGQTVQTSYNGSSVTLTDQVNRKMQAPYGWAWPVSDGQRAGLIGRPDAGDQLHLRYSWKPDAGEPGRPDARLQIRRALQAALREDPRTGGDDKRRQRHVLVVQVHLHRLQQRGDASGRAWGHHHLWL